MPEHADRILNIAEDQEIPATWRLSTLGDVATLQRGNDLPLSQRKSGHFPVVGSNGVTGFHSEAIGKGPGVLVGRSGTVGAVTWVETDYWPLNTALWVKDFHGNEPSFVYYLLKSLNLSFAATGVSVPTLNRNLVHPLRVAVPPLPDQRTIAHVLRRVQRAEDATEKVIASVRQLKKSLTDYLFRYGMVRPREADQVTTIETETGVHPLHWSVGAFDEFAVLQRGFDITKAEQQPGTVPVVSSSGIKSYHNTACVKGPGVVIGRKGSLGTTFYIQSDYWPHDTTLWVKDFKGNLPQFVYYFLATLKLESLDTGSSNPTLNRNYVHALNVAMPKIAEQEQIAHALEKMIRQKNLWVSCGSGNLPSE